MIRVATPAWISYVADMDDAASLYAQARKHRDAERTALAEAHRAAVDAHAIAKAEGKDYTPAEKAAWRACNSKLDDAVAEKNLAEALEERAAQAEEIQRALDLLGST